MLMGLHGLPADALHIVDGGGKADLAADVAGAGLKLAGAIGPGRAAFMHSADHIAAAHERGHLFQQSGACVQRTDAHGGVQLVGRAGRKIHVQLLDVHGGVGRALGAVQHDDSAHGVGTLHNFFYRRAQTQHVRDHRHGDDLRLGGDFFVQLLGGQAAVLAGIHINQLCAGGLGHALPRHHVGVVLGHGDDDFIALMQKIHAVAVGDEVQALRRVLGEHDLVVLCVKELRYGVAGSLMGVGGAHGQLVNAAVGVRVLFRIVIDHRV